MFSKFSSNTNEKNLVNHAVVCEDIWNVFFSEKYQFSDDSIPAYYYFRSIDSNLHLMSTAIILYK